MTRSQALGCTPVKNTGVKELERDSQALLLVYPAPVKPLFGFLTGRSGNSAGPHTVEKKLQLDLMGKEVWDSIDGRNTVQQIIHRFIQKHRLVPREAEVAVTKFLRELGRRGLIGLR